MVYQADGMRLVILDGKLTTMAEIYQPADPQGRNREEGGYPSKPATCSMGQRHPCHDEGVSHADRRAMLRRGSGVSRMSAIPR